jgi:hypothetical protein
MICLTLSRWGHGQINVGRNYTTQSIFESKMCTTTESQGYLSTRSRIRWILPANCSTDSPLVMTTAIWKSRSSKRHLLSKENKRTWPRKTIDEIPWSTGDYRKNSFSTSRYIRWSITGRERRLLWERGGRWEGGRDWHTIRSPTSTSVGRRGPCCICFVSFVRVVVQISQESLKSKEVLHFPSCPYTIFLGINLFVDVGDILRCVISGLYHLNPVSVCFVRSTLESIGGPRHCRYNGPLTGWRRPTGRNVTTFCWTQI